MYICSTALDYYSCELCFSTGSFDLRKLRSGKIGFVMQYRARPTHFCCFLLGRQQPTPSRPTQISCGDFSLSCNPTESTTDHSFLSGYSSLSTLLSSSPSIQSHATASTAAPASSPLPLRFHEWNGDPSNSALISLSSSVSKLSPCVSSPIISLLML